MKREFNIVAEDISSAVKAPDPQHFKSLRNSRANSVRGP
jgi:hypothetical protein